VPRAQASILRSCELKLKPWLGVNTIDPAISLTTRDLEISKNFPYAIFQLQTNQCAEFTDPFTGLPGPWSYTLKPGFIETSKNLYAMVPQIN
jgi:hypothetical protein